MELEMPLRQSGLLEVVHAPLCTTFSAADIAPLKHATVEGDSSRRRQRRSERDGDPVFAYRTMAAKFGVHLGGLAFGRSLFLKV
eukprot:3987751-Pleurochrysis_carterae.AAC.10